MHPLAAQYMAGLKDLRRWLDNSHLGELLSLYESFAEEERDGAIRRDLAFLPEPLASLTRFFVLGEHDQNAHVPETVRETLCGPWAMAWC